MKVSEIIYRIEDIKECRKLLADWNAGMIKNQNQIDALAEDIDTYLEVCLELLMNKEVK